MEGFRPLLAANAPKDFSKIEYPVYASPKIDGVRCLIHPVLGPVTRSLKPIPNKPLRFMLEKLPPGLDGELAVGEDPCQFHKTMSRVRRHKDPPYEMRFHVFDDFTAPDSDFQDRLDQVVHTVPGLECGMPVCVVPHQILYHKGELEAYLSKCMAEGFEGAMVRALRGRYKFNRSTMKEGILLKLKPWDYDTGICTGTERLMRNRNPPTKNALGLTQRATVGAGKVGDELVGKLILKSERWGEVKVGTGLNAQQRSRWWWHPNEIVGKRVEFKFQAIGTIDSPRCPVFKRVL